MDKVKSFLKGEKAEHEHSATSGSTHHSGSTSGVRDAAEAAIDSRSAPTTSTTSAPTATTETYDTRDETIAPAVAHETIKRQQEEQVQEVVDIEKHQDHYHTTVQPLVDREVAPTVHKEQVAQTQYSEVDHDDAAKTKAALEAEAAQFQNTRTDLGTTKTATDLGTVQSETVHNHLHETIQPVIEREIVQPSVVHTTVPIHEVVHEAAHVHAPSTAAPMTIDEFSKIQGTTQGSTQGSTNLQ